MTVPLRPLVFFLKPGNAQNSSAGKEFWILGFENIHSMKVYLFLLFTMLYIVTVASNSMIISLVFTARNIFTPMYFFLSHLSLSDILLTPTIVPEMLLIILQEGCLVSFVACFTQFYFFSQSAITECLILTVMSYDRYLAICNPLRYSSIMDLTLCCHLSGSSWLSGVLLALPHIIILSQMSFCRPNVINHFFCDLVPVLKLSCSGTSTSEVLNYILVIPLAFFPVLCISSTYANIFLAIHQISSTTGRQKAFSTCSSHLTVVCIYYGTLVFNYVIPARFGSLGLEKLVSLLYTTVTPLLNPVIYSLRNEEIRGALEQMVKKTMG